MSMIVMQTAIARLCVDAAFRHAFLHDAERTLEGLDLTPEETESIKALDMPAIGDYAGSLVAKRTGLIRRWFRVSIPFLEHRLGSHRVSHILQAYGLEQVRGGEQLGGEWVRAEFEAFKGYLLGLISRREIDISGFADLLELESVKFSMSLDPDVSSSASEFSQANSTIEVDFTAEFQNSFRPMLGAHARLHSFDYNVPEFIEQLEQEAETASLEPEPVDVLFFKKAREMRVDTSTINPPLKNLLEMCNGQHTIKSILSCIVDKYAPGLDGLEEELVDDCLAILRQLHAAGAITFIN